MPKITINSAASVTIDLDGVSTEGWKSHEKSEKQNWDFLDGDQMEALNEDLSNARAEGMESTLLALSKAGIIDLNNPSKDYEKRLQEALTEVFDALSNES